MSWSLRLAGCLFGPCVLAATAQYSVLTFHGDRQRTGWISTEKILTPLNVADGEFGPVWDSPPFDSVTISGITYVPHVYASPLYVDRVTLTVAAYAGRTFHVVYAASSNGFVYAVSASRASAPKTMTRGPNPAREPFCGGLNSLPLAESRISVRPSPPAEFWTGGFHSASWAHR